MNSLIKHFEQKSHVYLLVLSGFIVGLIPIIVTGIGSANFGDSPGYLDSATSIYNQGPYLRDNLAWPFFRAPGYPFLISTIWTLTGIFDIWILKVFNVICHSMSAYMIFRISRFSLSEKKSLVVALLYIINPFSLLQLSGVQTEPLITFLFLAFIYLILSECSKLNVFLLAFVSVFTIAVRPEYLFIIFPIIALSFILRQFPKGSKVRAIIVMVTIAISLSWWGMQNEKATGAFLPLTDATNFQLWQGSTSVIQQNYPWHTSTYPDFNEKQMNELVTEVRNQQNRWGKSYTDASISVKSEFWKRAYLENVTENPSRYLKYTLIKAVVFWRPFLNPASYGAKISIGSSMILLPLTFFMIFGFIRYRKHGDAQLLILAFAIGFISLTLIHAVQVADLRYKIPLFIPFATLMAGRLMADLSPKLKRVFSKIRSRITFS